MTQGDISLGAEQFFRIFCSSHEHSCGNHNWLHHYEARLEPIKK